jgi:hypothetical protein
MLLKRSRDSDKSDFFFNFDLTESLALFDEDPLLDFSCDAAAPIVAVLLDASFRVSFEYFTFCDCCKC